MDGPTLLARNLERATVVDRSGNVWQYHSRSDRHSKIGCWGIAFDLLNASALLRDHVASKKVVLGVNHAMTDFLTQRKKKLDLVIARPDQPAGGSGRSFVGLARQFGIDFDDAQTERLTALPEMHVADVGAVLVALEAKATMTAHVKALPRLYDELNSSHLCVHGSSEQALAIGYVQVNRADRFASSELNKHPHAADRLAYTEHRQPSDTQRVLEKVAELPRRNSQSGVGFDGIGVTLLDFANDGGRVRISTSAPAPARGDSFFYDTMIVRMANEYDTRFRDI